MTLLSDKRTRRANARRRGQGVQVAAVVAPATGRTVVVHTSHRRTGQIFEALLGLAACLSLVAVIHSTQTIDNSAPDAPPPVVFVQTD